MWDMGWITIGPDHLANNQKDVIELKENIHNLNLAILCALFWMIKWPLKRLSDLQLGDQKVTAWIIWKLVISKFEISEHSQMLFQIVDGKMAFPKRLFAKMRLLQNVSKSPKSPFSTCFFWEKKQGKIRMASINQSFHPHRLPLMWFQGASYTAVIGAWASVGDPQQAEVGASCLLERKTCTKPQGGWGLRIFRNSKRWDIWICWFPGG